MSSRKTSPETILLRADWVAPMIQPPIRDGAVLISEGRIQDVGAATELTKRHRDAEVQDLGRSVILPGLVNAHTHLELSDCTCGPPPADGLAGWLGRVLQRVRTSPTEMEASVARSIAIGVEQSLRFGVTTVGDISRQCALARSLLQKSPLRVVSYGEVQAMAQRRGLLEERLAQAIDSTHAGPRLKIGITPHAPYSVEPQAYRRCLHAARAADLPLATHLAETRDEAPFLADHSGPLRELWDKWLPWDDAVPTFTGGPILYAHELGLLDYPTLLAHVNYCDDEELAILAKGRASVVYCPRTHQYFGHPPHRWREMLARGINVAVGTDSCASSPDLNLVDELRLLHRLSPQTPAPEIWELATIRAARAIGMGEDAGAIRAGNVADLIAYAVQSNDPLAEILSSTVEPPSVWVEGKQIH